MTSLTDTQVITASGGLVELGYSALVSDQTVAAGANSVLIGPLTVVCDGSPIIVDAFWPRIDSPTNGETYVVVELDGASQNRIISSNSPTSLSFAAEHHGQIRLTPSAGSHTIQLRAYAGTNTATYRAASASGMAPAFLRVSKIVTATQWPAVTTGIIVCTSTTRPSSPFAGQIIYESDTALYQTYNGTSWGGTTNVGGLLTSGNFSTSGTANVGSSLTVSTNITTASGNITATSGNVYANRLTERMTENSFATSVTIPTPNIFTSAGAGGIIVYNSVSTITLTLPTASGIQSVMPSTTSSFDFVLRNNTSTTTHVLSASSTGITIYRPSFNGITTTTTLAIPYFVIFGRYVQTSSSSANIYLSA